VARIEVKWNDTTLSWGTTEAPGQATPAKVEGPTSLQQVATKAGKPTILFLFSASDVKKLKPIESAVFKNEKIGCASKMFHLARVDVRQKAHAQLPAELRENTPRFVFLSSTGENVATIEGNVTVPNFLAAMKKSFGREYSFSFDSLLKGQKEILDRVDRVESKKALLEQKLTALKNKKKSDKVEAEKKEIESDKKQVAEDEKKVLDDEKKLYQLVTEKRTTTAKG
jgi:hypothetical protein